MKTALQQVKQALSHCADTVGRNKAGNIVVRKGYFYRNGMDVDRFENTIQGILVSHKIYAQVVNKGDVWRPFRGGASVAQQSHFYVELAV